MNLSEEQLREAKAELDRREKLEADFHRSEYTRRMQEADQRFKEEMDKLFPGIDADTRYEIYSEYRDYYQ